MMQSWYESWVPIAGCAAAALLVGKLVSWHVKTRRLPPGPPKLPFIDNLHNIPAGMDYVHFAELGKVHNSGFIHMSALGNSIVIVNSYRVARDLLDRRSSIYSSRPVTTIMHDLSKLGLFFGLSPYGDYWRACRRLFTKHLSPGNTSIHQPRELFYSRRFLSQLLDSPSEYRQHIRHLVGSISISTVYGLSARPEGDPNIKSAEDLANALSDVVVAGTWLVDVIPALKYLPSWFPGVSFHKYAAELDNFSTRVRDLLFDNSKRNLEARNSSPSFVSECLLNLNCANNLLDEITTLKYSACQIYAAAADTTSSALGTFFLAMVCYPHVQRKLQEELDSALQGRLPTHEDIASLPYLTAVVMEVLRWRPVTPIGIPHMVIVDDVYEGFLIPKDSLVIANQWAMFNDPQDYPDPTAFEPERFLKDGLIDESVRNPSSIAFGFGRRNCPGQHIAHSILRITIASVLLAFDLSMATDADGNLIEPDQEYDLAFLCHPKHFPCLIRPRSAQAEALVKSWAVDADQVPA